MYNRDSRNITIKDVAAAAGVSIGTVSRVINNKGYLSEMTKRKVLDAIASTHFMDSYPNLTGSPSRQETKFCIGVVVPEMYNPFFASILYHIEKYLSLEGYSIILCNNMYDLSKTKRFIEQLLEYRVHGLLLVATNMDDSSYFDSLRGQMHISCVNTVISGCDCINVTDWQSSFELTEHLISLGHQDIAFMGHNSNSYATMERFRGFQDAMQKHNLKTKSEYILSTDGISSFPLQSDESGFHSPAEILADKLLNLSAPPTAIMAMNDYYALNVYRQCAKYGCEVGRDISLTGFDDIPEVSYISPSLTTVHYDIDYEAFIAVTTLLTRLRSTEDSSIGMDAKSILVPGHLRIRNSTKPVHDRLILHKD